MVASTDEQAFAFDDGSSRQTLAAEDDVRKHVAIRRFLVLGFGCLVASSCYVGLAYDGKDFKGNTRGRRLQSVVMEGVNETSAAVVWYGSGKVNKKSFWKGMRGIGFSSADDRGPWFMSRDPSKYQVARLDDTLDKIVSNGYNMIRTWRCGDYEGILLERIHNRSLDIKVQMGVWIDDDWEAAPRIDEAYRIASKFPHLILGFSVGNERMHFGHLTADQVRGHAEYAKKRYNMPVTYNFVVKTITYSRRRHRAKNWEQLVDTLDYVNVHLYGSHYEKGRYKPWWTPRDQVAAVRKQEEETFAKIGSSKPFVIGETGWQSRMFAASSVYNLRNYYVLITRHVYSSGNSLASSMFYFDLSDEAWKGSDDAWGLYLQGDKDRIGDANGAPKFQPTNVSQIIESHYMPKGDCCAAKHEWPGLKSECSGCVALVTTSKGTCGQYCASFGHVCVGAGEEVENDCDVLYSARCDQEIPDTSDILCTCQLPSCD